jgi:ferredoxin
LRQRGLDTLGLRRITAAQWQRVRDRTRDREAGPRLSRRQLLRSALHRAAEQVGPGSEPAAMSFQPPGRYLPSRSGEVVIFCPEIDPERCTGCGDCARICPQHVVQLYSGQGTRGSLRTDPDLCTGCGLCRDLCSVGAIEILRWGVPRREEIPLTRSRCGACGAPYWHPPEGDSSSCPICLQRRHNDRLFQVLD